MPQAGTFTPDPPLLWDAPGWDIHAFLLVNLPTAVAGFAAATSSDSMARSRDPDMGLPDHTICPRRFTTTEAGASSLPRASWYIPRDSAAARQARDVAADSFW